MKTEEIKELRHDKILSYLYRLLEKGYQSLRSLSGGIIFLAVLITLVRRHTPLHFYQKNLMSNVTKEILKWFTIFYAYDFMGESLRGKRSKQKFFATAPFR